LGFGRLPGRGQFPIHGAEFEVREIWPNSLVSIELVAADCIMMNRRLRFGVACPRRKAAWACSWQFSSGVAGYDRQIQELQAF
jgi:hypothetical protein